MCRPLLLLLSLFAVSCGGDTKTPADPVDSTESAEAIEIFSGVHLVGFEVSAFYGDASCAKSKGVWLKPRDATYGERLEEIFPVAENEAISMAWVDLRFEGRRSPPKGRYGHLDRWSEQVELIRVIEARPSTHCGPNPSIRTSHIEIIDTLRFAETATDLDSRAMEILQSLSATFESNPELHVKVLGHTTSSETSRELAGQRASRVVDALVAEGVDAERLSIELRDKQAERESQVSFEVAVQ